LVKTVKREKESFTAVRSWESREGEYGGENPIRKRRISCKKGGVLVFFGGGIVERCENN